MISELLISYGIPLVTWLLGILGIGMSFVMRQIWKNARLLEVMTRLGHAVRDAVNDVFQTYISELRRANADGKLTDEEKAIAKQMAIERAKVFLGRKGIKVLLYSLGMKQETLDTFLGGQVESEIRKQKLEVEKAAASGGGFLRRAAAMATGTIPPVPPLGV